MLPGTGEPSAKAQSLRVSWSDEDDSENHGRNLVSMKTEGMRFNFVSLVVQQLT